MVLCPRCKTELGDDVTECFVCGYDLSQEEESRWVILGTIKDKISADFAKEALKSYEIPAVVFSRSGFFGTAGLPLNPIYSSKTAAFEISVPARFKEEATGILDMTLGSRWCRKED